MALHGQIRFKGQHISGSRHKHGKPGSGNTLYRIICFQRFHGFCRNTDGFICDRIVSGIHILNGAAGIEQPGKAL